MQNDQASPTWVNLGGFWPQIDQWILVAMNLYFSDYRSEKIGLPAPKFFVPKWIARIWWVRPKLTQRHILENFSYDFLLRIAREAWVGFVLYLCGDFRSFWFRHDVRPAWSFLDIFGLIALLQSCRPDGPISAKFIQAGAVLVCGSFFL